MIQDVLTWWWSQMRDLVPARFARPDPSAVGALLVEPLGDGNTIRLSRRRAGMETVQAEIPLVTVGDAGPDQALQAAIAATSAEGGERVVLLRLPASGVLQREVTLPLGAEAALDRVLAYEMDRLTPFAAADVFYGWQIMRRDREAGRLRLRLSLVPKAPLGWLLESLRLAGAMPRAIEVALPGQPSPLRIALGHERPVAEQRERRMLMAAGFACAGLAFLAILLPFVLQSAADRRIEHRIALLQPQVSAAQALRRRIAGSSAGTDLVAAERRRLGDSLGVIAAVTRVLPDDSYLSDLTLREGVLTISGQSPGAARLIPAISADPAFSAPTFAAPVTRVEAQNTELFSIRAGVAR